MSRHGFMISLALIAAAMSLAFSQTPASPPPDTAATVKVKARLVLVDVVVTNDKGDPVTGLEKKDFEVFEDGKPQTLATFEEHHGAEISQIQLPPLPPHVYTNFPLVQSADSVNVILLDALNTPAHDQVYVHSEMLKYLRKIPPGTRVAIFTLASRLRMLQGVTTDSTQLLAALNMTGPQQSPLLASEVEKESNDHFVAFLQQEDMGPPPPTLELAAVDPIEVAKQFLADTAAFETEQRIQITLEAMQQLARYLADVPGRKNVIWFSGSFPTGIFADPDLPDPSNIARSFQDEIRKTTDLLASAQLAIYPVAAEGLAPDAVYQANGQEISQTRPSMAVRDQVKQLQAGETSRDLNHGTMEDLAKDTGGKAYYNTNGLSDALARVVNNGSRYYSLAYSPSNSEMNGKFRRIQIKLVNAKGTLAYRRGYYADDLATELSSGRGAGSDPLLPLMGRNLPDYSRILFKVLVQPSNPQPAPDAPHIGSNTEMKGPFTRYSVDFAISAKDLNLEAGPDGEHHGSIEVALLAYSREGKPLNFVVMQGNIALQPKDYDAVRRSGLPIHKEIDVPDGYAFLRTGVYDLELNTAGTLGIPLTDTIAKAAK
jgi:VWFA-related protein